LNLQNGMPNCSLFILIVQYDTTARSCPAKRQPETATRSGKKQNRKDFSFYTSYSPYRFFELKVTNSGGLQDKARVAVTVAGGAQGAADALSGQQGK
jgi:hypothetical protein